MCSRWPSAAQSAPSVSNRGNRGRAGGANRALCRDALEDRERQYLTLPHNAQSLANALSVPITLFFKGFEATRSAVHTKAGATVSRWTGRARAGHQYTLLGHIGANSSGVIVEPYMITLTDASDVFETFQHSGWRRSTCSKGPWFTDTATPPMRLRLGIRCSLTPTPPMGRRHFVTLPCPLSLHHFPTLKTHNCPKIRRKNYPVGKKFFTSVARNRTNMLAKDSERRGACVGSLACF